MRNLVCIFDAGSAGTRLILYEKIAQSVNLVKRVPYPINLSSQKIESIFSYFDHIISLAKLTDYSMDKIQYMFFATESMRRLPVLQQKLMMDKVLEYFTKKKFLFTKSDVRILSGLEEAISSYKAIKYILKDERPVFTLIELGGGSMQIVNENYQMSIEKFGFAKDNREKFFNAMHKVANQHRHVFHNDKENMVILIGFFFDFFSDFYGKFSELKLMVKNTESKFLISFLTLIGIEDDRKIYILKEINGYHAEWSLYQAIKKFN